MILGEHVLERYVQRVIGIDNKGKALKYLKKNYYEVFYQCSKFVNDSKVLSSRHKMTRGDYVTFHINEGVVIVINRNTREVITLYNVGKHVNGGIEAVEKLAKKIRNNENLIAYEENRKKKRDRQTFNIQYMIEQKERELEELQEELIDSIETGREHLRKINHLREENSGIVIKITGAYKQKGRDK